MRINALISDLTQLAGSFPRLRPRYYRYIQAFVNTAQIPNYKAATPSYYLPRYYPQVSCSDYLRMIAILCAFLWTMSSTAQRVGVGHIKLYMFTLINISRSS